MSELMPEKESKNESAGEGAFQGFCALVFLTMIGLVFYNAILRYVFRASFAPSEEWARFLFMYITFFGAIEASLKKKQDVRLVGFGTFSLSKRKAGVGRNPRTGEEIKIPASTTVRFKAGKGLKDAVG